MTLDPMLTRVDVDEPGRRAAFLQDGKRRMGGFWYPYADFEDARRRLTAFADASVGLACGISFSDGRSISVVRKPTPGGEWLWLNILTRHVAAPPPPPIRPSGIWGNLKAAFWHAMEISGEAQIQQSQANLAMGQAVDSAIERHIWLPVHQFLIRHKLLADGIGVALDVVGVVAGAIFIVAALPELAGGAVIIGTAGVITGGAAFTGSLVLAGIDGTVFGFEVSGNEARAERVENNSTVQWLRIGATVMLLPDVAVGGVRALGEIGKLGNEGREATSASAEAARNAEAARARVGKIAHPERHPGPVQRRTRKVAAFERAVEAQARAASEAHARIRLTVAKDLAVVPGASLGSTGLLMAAPPALALSAEQRGRDERYRRSLAPEGGMPKDVRLEMRVSGHARIAPE